MATKKIDRIRFLEAQIRRHQDLYYNGKPEISDAEFDELWDELSAIDKKNPILGTIGSDFADGWPKAAHVIPMGSQAKASNPEDFLSWAAKTEFDEYIVQYKLDGASLELQYEKGLLRKAVTRGDGAVGDDITPNASRMGGVPLRLNEAFTGGVRGEVLMPRAIHAEKYADKANCRNAANGLMKRKDGIGSQDLVVLCYDALGIIPDQVASTSLYDEVESRAPFRDEAEKLLWLRRIGFAVVPFERLRGAEAVVEYRGRIMDLRPSLPWDIDGLVVKGLEIDPEDMSRARPEKQIAFKFSLEEAVSTLRCVEWSESGASYTPIGIVDPVRLAGTEVKRANLCNTNIISSLGLRIGSRVVLTKRGEIIPKIESLVENPPEASPIPVPETCSCGTSLVDEGTRLYCPNSNCPKRSLHRLEKWLSVLDIRDFGSVILGKLHASGRVRSIPDLYTLKAEELAEFDRMGIVLARKILKNLAAKNEISLSQFIAGFDIEGIGELIAEKAVKAGLSSIEKLRAATVEELDAIEGIAEITARAILEGLAALASEMDALLASGSVRIKPRPEGGALEGKSFCFTGELKTMKRPEAEALVKALGGMAKASVSKELSYLVNNDPYSGSEKNKKAIANSVPIISEDVFLEMMGRA